MTTHRNGAFRSCWSLLRSLKSRLSRRPAPPKAAPQPHLHDHSLAARYEPCRALQRRGIPNVVWFEDALMLHGSDTAVFDLYLLVPDGREALSALLQVGYQETIIDSPFPDDVRACRGGLRLKITSDDNSKEGIVLIDAKLWDYDLPEKDDFTLAPVPPLNHFLDAIMGYWLALTEEAYGGNFLWSLSVACLIGYAYTIQGPDGDLVRSEEFASQLRPEHRELHYDLAGDYPNKSGISSYQKHKYHVLRAQQIKDGTFSPRPYPKGNFPTSMAEFPELTGMYADISVPKKEKKSRKKERLQSIEENGG